MRTKAPFSKPVHVREGDVVKPKNDATSIQSISSRQFTNLSFVQVYRIFPKGTRTRGQWPRRVQDKKRIGL